MVRKLSEAYLGAPITNFSPIENLSEIYKFLVMIDGKAHFTVGRKNYQPQAHHVARN